MYAIDEAIERVGRLLEGDPGTPYCDGCIGDELSIENPALVHQAARRWVVRSLAVRSEVVRTHGKRNQMVRSQPGRLGRALERCAICGKKRVVTAWIPEDQ